MTLFEMEDVLSRSSDFGHLGNGEWTTENDSLGHCVRQDRELSDLLFYAYGITPFIIIGIGVICNALTLIVLLRCNVFQHGMSHVYFLSLAATDLGALLSCISFSVRLSLNSPPSSYAAAYYFAHVELPFLTTLTTTSFLIVTCLTIERFQAVWFPHRFRASATLSSRAKVRVLLCYLIAFALSVPLALMKTVKSCYLPHQDPEQMDKRWLVVENTRMTSQPAWKAFIYTEQLICKVIPILCVTILNCGVVHRFHASTKRKGEVISSRTAQKEDRRIGVLLIAVSVIFVSTVTPSAVLSLVYTESYESNYGFQVFRAFANNLEIANFSLNFFVYFFCSREFHSAFLMTICCQPFPDRRDSVAVLELSTGMSQLLSTIRDLFGRTKSNLTSAGRGSQCTNLATVTEEKHRASCP